jgi:esterase/lipase superfamily enzyme
MKARESWYSPRIEATVNLVRWGAVGTPVLLFPTAGGDAEEAERFLMLDALSPLLAAGRIKVYSCDSVAGRVLTEGRSSAEHCSWILKRFHDAIYHEIVPAIRADCRSPGIEIVTAGASIGAFNALAALCCHPDAFRTAICLSGTFDLVRFLPHGQYTQDFYFVSPIHFLPNLGEGPQLERLRSRFVLFATGQGRWEEPEQSWRMARVLGAKGIPNRVDPWGHEFDHDWSTWRQMLPGYLDALT